MKDIYINMANQNILRFYGSKLDLKVDYSELYDYELSKVQGDYNEEVLDFTNEITYTGLTINSSCLTTGITSPWMVEVNKPYTGDTCDFMSRRRTEKGWTVDLVFGGLVTGTTFYYLGIRGEFMSENYADNNLTFSFTNDNKIKWEAFHYSGTCDADMGYSESYYTLTGETPQLCPNGIYNDFNITITFDRYKYYFDCEVENEGGYNDLILGTHPVEYSPSLTASTSTQITTGYTVTNEIHDWVTGGTLSTQYVEELNKKWASERQKRLGILRIYHNGKRIYKLENFEEVIPSLRSSQFGKIYQVFGSNALNGILKQVKYFEEPLDFVHVKHHYLTSIKPNYLIYGCSDVLPSPTPTPTPTPSVTPTNTPTPSVTPTSSGVIPESPTPTPTPSSTPPILYVELNVGVGNSYSESCDNYSSSSLQTLYSTKDISLIVVGDIIYSDTDGGLYSGYFSYGSNWYYISFGEVITIQSCSVIPTTPPSIINSLPPSGFTFNADYIIVTYSFTDGSDLDTRTRISNPNVGMNEYLGWANLDSYPIESPQSILTWGGDNTGNGYEAVLIDLKQFKIQYPSETFITIDMNAMWYSQIGTNPVIMEITMYKGGIVVPDPNNFSFVAIDATGKYGVASTGTVVNLLSQNASDLEHVSSLQYNLSTYNGQFI